MTARRLAIVAPMVIGVVTAELDSWLPSTTTRKGELFDPESGSIRWHATLILASAWFIAGARAPGSVVIGAQMI